MIKLMVFIGIAAIITVDEVHAAQPEELVEFRFRSEYVADDLEEVIGKHIKLFPTSYETLVNSECFRVEKIDRKHEKDLRERLVIICAPEQRIFDQVTRAYWEMLNKNSLGDLAMRVEATTSVGCGAKKCPNNAHYGATPCGYKNVPPYGTLCVHTNYPNVNHVCMEMAN